MQPTAPDIISMAQKATADVSSTDVKAAFDNIIIVLSAPRSGSTLLFEQLSKDKKLWTIRGESHAIFRAFPSLRAQNNQLDSMALSAEHADEKTCDLFRRCFLFGLCDNQGQPLLSRPKEDWPETLYILEKTPRNALNIPFLLEVFPKAKFIYLYRDPRQTVASLLEAWSVGLRSGRFVTFRNLPNWHLPGWCFLLPAGWRTLQGKTLPDITAFQWVASNEAIMADLAPLSRERWVGVNYDDMVEDMPHTIDKIFKSLQVSASETLQDITDSVAAASEGLALSRTTISPPHKDKWKRFEGHIMPLWPQLSVTLTKIQSFVKA